MLSALIKKTFRLMAWCISIGVSAPWIFGLLYLFMCVGACAYMTAYPLLTTEDQLNTSWLATYSISTFLLGVVVKIICCAFGALSGLLLLSKKFFGAVISLLFSACLYFCGQSGPIYETGIYFNTIKIGCYVWNSDACISAFHLKHPQSIVKLHDAINPLEKSLAYQEALANTPYSPNPWILALHNVPGGFFLTAPFAAWHRPELIEKIKEQKEALASTKN